MTNPQFSIIIPVYNVAPYLRECLDSVLSQTFVDWEAICVDDGSTDGSGSILDEYSDKDPRIMAVHCQNCGVSAARNRGISLARGEYFCFVDSDDVLHHSFLHFFEIAIDKRPDLIMAGTLFFDGDDMPQWRVSSNMIDSLCVDDVSKFVRESLVLRPACGAVAYKRELFASARFKPYKMGEDYLFLTECLMVGECVVSTEEKLYAYRQRKGSACHSIFDLRKVEDYCQAMCEVLHRLTESTKVFPNVFIRRMYLNLAEKIPFLILSLPAGDCEGAFGVWRRCVLELRRMNFYCIVTMLISRVAVRINHVRFACFLCSLPYRLKIVGLHR